MSNEDKEVGENKRKRKEMPKTKFGRVPYKNPKYMTTSSDESGPKSPKLCNKGKSSIIEEWTRLRELAEHTKKRSETSNSNMEKLNLKECIQKPKVVNASEVIPQAKIDAEIFCPPRVDMENEIQTLLTTVMDTNERVKNLEQQNIVLQEAVSDNSKKIVSLERALNKKNTMRSILRVQGYPIKTLEQFYIMENPENEEARIKMGKRLLTLGAITMREFASMAIKETVSDEVITKFTWEGNQNMKKFDNTQLSTLIFDSAKECEMFEGPSCIAEFKTHISEVFRATKQRFKKSKKALHSKNSEEENEEQRMEDILRLLEK
ncbi:unnamed protein product [Brassicogethes aeneus]|uniref:DUF4806 domain-containing protein n=1 Tax=Brassicogethes aeneus TaxID=1431903 RepID=A0A9P0F905_BRAAE|nr:unnamed protein product [Brassicogethes aeneus]